MLVKHVKDLDEQVTQLVYYGYFSYRDLLSMEISERNRYYQQLVIYKEKENEQAESSSSNSPPPDFRFRPDLSKVPKFN